MRLVLFSAVFLAALALDQISKFWISVHFVLFESRELVPGFFNLTYVTNNGAAFSILAGQPALWRQAVFVLINLVALAVIGLAQYRFGRNNRLYTVSLALIAGGAAGNLCDRMRLSHVIDFLDFYIGAYHWPAFNIADSAIVLGVALFMFNSIFLEPRQEKQHSHQPL